MCVREFVTLCVCVCIQSCLAGWQNHLRIHSQQKQFQFKICNLIYFCIFFLSFFLIFVYICICASVCVCLLLWSKFCRFFNRFFFNVIYKTFRTSLWHMLQLQNEPIIFWGFLLSFLMLLRTEGDRERGRGSETESVRSGGWPKYFLFSFLFYFYF